MAMMTKEEGQAFKLRWKLVNEYVYEEARQMSVEARLQGLADLYETAVQLGWLEKMHRTTDEVSARWQRLRSVLNGR